MAKTQRTKRRGWMEQIIDPNGTSKKPIYACDKKNQEYHKNYTEKKKFKHQLFSDRKLKQWERLEWVADKIVKNWTLRKIHLEFAKTYGMHKDTAGKYIKKIYQDFESQFTDPTKRNLLLAEHAAAIKEGMRAALVSEDLQAFNMLARQYAETVGILTPAHLLKFQVNDNRQQNSMIVGNVEEARATLKSLEMLSEQDLFRKTLPLLNQGIEGVAETSGFPE